MGGAGVQTGVHDFLQPHARSCTTCKTTQSLPQPGIMNEIESSNYPTINKWFEHYQKNNDKKCMQCNSSIETIKDMSSSYNFFTLYWATNIRITINKSLRILRPGTNNATLTPLRGIIYWGGAHFVSRIIDTDKNVWYYNGMTTGRKCEYEDKLSSFSDAQLSIHKDEHGVSRKAIMVIYAKK